MGPQNGIMGDENMGMDLPQTILPEELLDEAKKKARFSKTAEFKELKEYIESRIKYFQDFLPDGRSVGKNFNATEAGYNWLAANTIIGELRGLLNAYEQAAIDVKEAAKRNAR